MVTMFHWDLPQPLQEIGGWPNPILADYFVDYADALFSNFGDRVTEWITFNEPHQVCGNGYSTGDLAPAYTQDGVGGYWCSYTLLMAHARTYELYNNNYRETQQGRIGFTMHGIWTLAASDADADVQAAENYVQFYFGWFAHPIYSSEGDFPAVMKERIAQLSEEEGFARSRLPTFTDEEVELLRELLLMVKTHECRALVDGEAARPSNQADHGAVCGQPPGTETAASSWLYVYPDGIRQILNWINEEYDNPEILNWINEEYDNPEVIITESGFSDSTGTLNDCGRVNYYNEYLAAVLQAINEAINEGCDVTAYTAWSFMDNFEWMRGYTEKFGIHHVDFDDSDRTRTPKMSSYVFKNIIETRTIDTSYVPDGFEACATDEEEEEDVDNGEDGNDGDNGEDGNDGDNGEDGNDGDNGEDGNDGDNGEDGNDGDNGEDGNDGDNGEDGNDGDNGEDGNDGDNGEDGNDGDNGEDGNDGDNGEDGNDGDNGEDGNDGDNGEDETFWFGVASASYQVEGAWNLSGKGENIWDRLTHSNPDHISDRSNGDVACDAYHKIAEDVRNLKNLGVDVYRFSLSWSRILPTGHSNKINPDGIRYYNELIDELIRNDIKPFVTIYHWDLPQPLQEIGGWPNPLIIDHFVDFADVVFENFGDRVQFWITFNEPTLICLHGYGFGSMAPAYTQQGIVDYLCGHNLILAHAKTYRLYQDKYKKSQNGRVGITCESPWFEPVTPGDSLDELMSEKSLQTRLGWYTHPIFSEEGDYPQVMRDHIDELSEREGYSKSRLPKFTEEEVQLVKGTSDFFGLNHYTSELCTTMKWEVVGPSHQLDVGAHCETNPEWETAASFWLKVVPWGLRKLLNWIRDEYNNPEVIITENGFSDLGGLNDCRRINYYNRYLTEVLKAIHDDDCNISGYVAWSYMDNFQWDQGYTERFGMYFVDFEDPSRPRTPKMSSQVYKNIIQSRRIDWDYTPHGFTPCNWEVAK
ncbi:Collagen triple helix repeat (20 copies) [Popillia japonica]|uniref:beta-glucosidase n=1 Tax=Popillia japonica TaxID=7064 RepID=A0AAW1KR22_POPJA